jgi:indolepyruvate ferredoxin oxidoreductase beta subunit
MLKGTDYILSFELLEGLRNLKYLADDGVLMVNDFVWEPLPVAAGLDEYPEDVKDRLKKGARKLVIIPASKIALNLGNIRATNIVLIGVLARNMDIEKEIWQDMIRKKIAARFVDLNLKAFEEGYGFKSDF